MIISAAIVACAPLKQNVQIGNSTGKIEDNRWDYYDGRPVPYTSNQRSVTKNDLVTANEMTDMFQVTINAEKGKEKAVMVMNGQTIFLTRFNQSTRKDYLFNNSKRHWGNRGVLDNPTFSDWYISDDEKYYLIISQEKQMALTMYLDGDEAQSINYYPSRFLACKKIALVKNEKNSAVVRDLLKTAMVAGIQSYTSYSRGTYTGNYGNFGFITVRDYSWAGARASDALSTLFSGQYSEEKINVAWDSLNCW